MEREKRNEHSFGYKTLLIRTTQSKRFQHAYTQAGLGAQIVLENLNKATKNKSKMPLQNLTLQPLLQGELRGHITTDTNINERGPPPQGL